VLRIVHVEEIESLLLALPALVREQEEHASFFPENVLAWLMTLEKAFENNKLYQAAQVAMLRSTLVSARQGQVPAGIEFKGLPSRTKVQRAVAAQALQKASELASVIVAENRKRIAEGEAIAQQLIAVALSRGLVEHRDPVTSNTEYLSNLRDRLISADLANAVLHLEGLVGPNDILILLDRALALRRAILATVP
jgi:hypothetical protein